MKKIIIVAFIYEESGGTKKVIDNLAEKYETFGFKVNILVVIPPVNSQYKRTQNRTITYLCESSNFSILDSINLFQKAISSICPDRIFFILGNWFNILLASCLTPAQKKITILYFLDPWFTFGNLKKEIHKLASKFIAIRSSLLSNKTPRLLNNVFEKFRAVENSISNESINISFFNDFLGIIVCSKDMVSFFQKKIGVSKNKILCLPLYVENVSTRTKTDTNPQNATIIYAARATSSWKGFWLILEAMKIMQNVKLEVYTWDRSEALFIEKLRRLYRINSKRIVVRSGLKTEDFAQRMHDATAVIIPSITEGFSFTMLESMAAYGITVVGALYGGPRDVVVNNHNGFVFKPGDSKSLSKTIKQVMQLKYPTSRIIRDAAHKTSQKYTFKKYWLTLNKKFPL